MDVLVHLAAAVSGGEDAQFAATVVGTERLLEAMARHRLTEGGAGQQLLGLRLERHPGYAGRGLADRACSGPLRARRLRHRQVLAGAGGPPGLCAHGWDLTVLRPGFIWGRDHENLAALGSESAQLHLVIGPLTHLPMTHVENCADLFALAAVDPRASGQTFNVVDGEGERIWSYLGEVLRGTGQRGLRVPVPYGLAHRAVQLAFATVFRRNLKLPHILIPCRFESRLKPLRYTNRRVREALGWTPPLDFRECLRRTFEPEGPRAAA